MAKRLQYKRLLLLAMLLGVAFAGLGYRLVDLQVLRHEELRDKSEQFTERKTLREPRRGDILDARGNLLATSVFVKTVSADPVLIGDRQADVARAIAPLLGKSEGEIYQRLLPGSHRNEKGQVVTNRYVVLKRKVSPETWQKIQTAMGHLSFGVEESTLSRKQQAFYRDLRKSAIFTDPLDDQVRVYPNQSLAAHVLGFVGMEDRQPSTNSASLLETVGKEGIELALNSKLAGARGWRVTETDRRSREVVAARDQDVEARDGFNVVLTIDSVIQNMLESALAKGMEANAPSSISGLIVRPRTGEIVALASLPNFNPNNPGANADARRNRVITDAMEPGSTFKIVVVSGALNDQIVRLSDLVDCEQGRFTFAGGVLHDPHGGHGTLSVENIITKSSNIGAAKIGIKMGPGRLYDYMRGYGFGARTGIYLPGESPGILHPVENWTKISIAQIPMGQGVAVTRLQMVMAMCAMANDGWLMRPMLVKRLEDREGHLIAQYSPQRVRQVVSNSTARLMTQALKTVVSADGTAPKAALEHYTVAGKTGTAQKAGAGGYLPDKYVSSFIGFFPADNPELCISIVMDEPKQGYYGGQTAAPVFKQVAERAASYLSIRPDNGEEQPSPGESVATTPPPRVIKTVAARPLTNH